MEILLDHVHQNSNMMIANMKLADIIMPNYQYCKMVSLDILVNLRKWPSHMSRIWWSCEVRMMIPNCIHILGTNMKTAITIDCMFYITFLSNKTDYKSACCLTTSYSVHL